MRAPTLEAGALRHVVSTVAEMRWKGIENGELLALIREAGFEAFITVDENLPHQQNLRAAGIRVVVLVARTNKLQDLQLLIPAAQEALEHLQPGEMIRVTL
jgi:tryptophan synthase alpha subunit